MLLKLMPVLLVVAACSEGHVNFGPDAGRGGNGGSYPLRGSYNALHPLTEASGAEYDSYANTGSSNTTHDFWFMPRVAGKPVVRRYSEGTYYWGDFDAQEVNQGVCSLRLEYEIERHYDCGASNQCYDLRLLMTHLIPDHTYCGDQPLTTMTIEESADAQSLSYQPDLSADLAGDGATLAQRRKVAALWRTISTENAPPALMESNVYIDGDDVLVFGISVSGEFAGAHYSPATNAWEALPKEGMPELDRYGAWTSVAGKLMVVTAGKAAWLKDGTWEPLPIENMADFTQGGSPGCVRMAANGVEVLLWGNAIINNQPTSFGSVFDADSGSWRAANPAAAPNGRCYVTVQAIDRGIAVVLDDGTAGIYYPQGQGAWQLADAAAANGKVAGVYSWSDGVGISLISADRLVERVLTGAGDWREERFPSNRFGFGFAKDKVAFGGITFDSEGRYQLLDDGLMRLPGENAFETLQIPRTDLLGARANALVTYLPPSTLFVWGGCIRYVGDRCTTYANDGALLDADLGL